MTRPRITCALACALAGLALAAPAAATAATPLGDGGPAPGDARARLVAGPGLGTWNAATPGVQRYRFRKPIQNLPAPATYFVRVMYRWKDAGGRTFARTIR